MLCRYAVLPHARAQFLFDFFHSLLGTLVSQGPTQLFRFSAGEIGAEHRHAQQLLLKKRHAERSLEDRLQRRMRICHRFFPLTSPEVWAGHLSCDRARANQRHLRHQIIKLLRIVSGKRGHLRPRFDLEHPNGVGLADGFVDVRDNPAAGAPDPPFRRNGRGSSQWNP